MMFMVMKDMALINVRLLHQDLEDQRGQQEHLVFPQASVHITTNKFKPV